MAKNQRPTNDGPPDNSKNDKGSTRNTGPKGGSTDNRPNKGGDQHKNER